MRILQVHNFYRQTGGEDVVVENEAAMLTAGGHEVHLWSAHNESIVGLRSKLRTAWRAPYSRRARSGLAGEIQRFEPDVVHAHNFFPLLTPAIYDACRDAGVPVVQTLHNYRTICAGAFLSRGGRPCEICISRSPYHGALHACYRDSHGESLAAARMIAWHRRRATWRHKIDRFIALTRFAKSKFVAAGFPEDRIAVKPNFVEDHGDGITGQKRHGALFAGRLSAEKGIITLVRAWRALDLPLRIAGEGPLAAAVREAAAPNVTMLGLLTPHEVRAEMARASFLVMPSECYEGFGLTIAEGFCRGLPVIASRLGAMAEIVDDGVTGLHFTPGDADDLAAKVRWAADHPEDMRRMGAAARRVYTERYTPAINARQLVGIYEAVLRRDRP